MCVRLAAVWSQSTDEIFRTTYVERTAGSAAAARIFKLAELNRLSVYWNADDSLLARRTKGAAAPRSGKRALDLATCPIQQFASKFRDLLPRQGHDVAEHSYILKELSASMKLKINRDPMNRLHPQHEVTLAIARINLIVEDFQVLVLCSPPTRPQLSLSPSTLVGVLLVLLQYTDIARFVSALSAFGQREELDRLRPRQSAVDNPRAWWQYLVRVAPSPP